MKKLLLSTTLKYCTEVIPTYCVYITAAFYGFFLFKRNTSSSYLHVSMRRIDNLNQSETYCCISALLSYCKHFPYGQDTVRCCNYASTTSIARQLYCSDRFRIQLQLTKLLNKEKEVKFTGQTGPLRYGIDCLFRVTTQQNRTYSLHDRRRIA